MKPISICFGVLIACGAPVDERVTTQSASLGEITNGFPSALERLGLMAINRARSDPQTVKGAQSTSYPARPPVQYSEALSHSARFHATSLALSDVTLMHPSPCTLLANVATSGCNGAPSCACASPVPTACAMCANTTMICGTDPFTRIGYFTAGTAVTANGEVAAAGYIDPIAVVDGWMDEAAGADGHRKNLTDQGIASNVMGYGRAVEAAACFNSFDVCDSGNQSNLAASKLPTAAVTPPSGVAGAFTFYATWADPTNGEPAAIDVVVDGGCTAMTRELGTDTLNATYKLNLALTNGCHNYYILATDGAGARIAYPNTVALTIEVGGVTCAGDSVAQPTAACEGGGAPKDGGRSAPADGGGTADAGGGTTASHSNGGCTFATGDLHSASALLIGAFAWLASRRRRALSAT